MVSLPDFDPNRYRQASPEARFNRTTQGTYELGSLFKLFAIAMALDAGVVDMDGGYDATQPLQIGRHRISDFRAKRRWLSVPEIMAFSSNIGAAKMAKLGAERQLAYLARFGLLQRHPIACRRSSDPQVPSPWRPINTVTAAYGHGIAVSPLQVVDAARRDDLRRATAGASGRQHPLPASRRRCRPRPPPSCAGSCGSRLPGAPAARPPCRAT